jgi:hypothetical protein
MFKIIPAVLEASPVHIVSLVNLGMGISGFGIVIESAPSISGPRSFNEMVLDII